MMYIHCIVFAIILQTTTVDWLFYVVTFVDILTKRDTKTDTRKIHTERHVFQSKPTTVSAVIC